MKIAVLGGGNMGGAIAAGALASGIVAPHDMTVSYALDPLKERFAQMGAEVKCTTDNAEAVRGADIIFLAVKPWMAEQVLGEIKESIDPRSQIVASVVSGVSFEQLKKFLHMDGRTAPVLFRIIPNTAIAIGQSVTFVVADGASEHQRKEICKLFAAMGVVFEITEDEIEAATSLTSCGIAFVFKYIDASIKGAVQVGIDQGSALRMFLATVKGAVAMLEHNHSQPQQEIDKVTTPGGITLRGLEAMEREGFEKAVIAGIKESKW